ncbi:MAG TPA: hypothetical protein VIM16_16785 [Mucilaginibacter sp.]|jgi:hypothetical protein
MKNLKIIRILCLVIGIGSATATFAQRGSGGHGQITPVKVGSVIVNAGIGVGSTYDGDYYNSAFGIKGAIEWGLWQAGPGVITLGAEAGGSFANNGYPDYTNYNSNTIIIAARAAWHYGWLVRGLDTYGGVSAGLGFHHFEYDNPNLYAHDSVIGVPGVFVGASYFVTRTFGFNAEAGHDITNIQFGVVFKIN